MHLAVARIATLLLLLGTACAGGAPSPSQSSASTDAGAGPDTPSVLPSASPSPTQNPEVIPTAPTGPRLEGTALTGTNDDGRFRLTIHADQDRYRAGQELQVTASLAFLGAEPEVAVSGSGTGLVVFGVERDQPPIRIGPAGTTDCRPSQLRRDTPMEVSFFKTGGYDPSEPLAPFYESYLFPRELRLAAGTWTISAIASFNEGTDCTGRGHDLQASVRVVVEP
jgi:hypothetical protein